MSDLALEEFPVDGMSQYFAMIGSGDGLFPTFSQGLAAELRLAGVAAAVVPSMRYFWRKRSPRLFAEHMANRLLKHFEAQENAQFMLIGYSFGGAVLPFAVRLLPPELRNAISLVVLAAPALRADFEFKFRGWLDLSSPESADVEAELDLMIAEGARTLLIYGERDRRRALTSHKGASILMLPTGHDLGQQYCKIASEVIQNAETATTNDAIP